jgi:hypothetical protein
MTRKIVFFYHTGYCGSDGCEMHEYPDDVSDNELDNVAWHGALDNAASYGYYPTSDMPEDYNDEEYEGGDEYSDNIEGYWEEYDAEKHDGLF